MLLVYVNVVEFTDYWVCKKGVGYYGLGAFFTLPVVCMAYVGTCHSRKDSFGIPEILTNTYVTCDAPRLSGQPTKQIVTEAWPDRFFVFKALFFNLIVVLYIQSLED